jgi:hypothetical protein
MTPDRSKSFWAVDGGLKISSPADGLFLPVFAGLGLAASRFLPMNI